MKMDVLFENGDFSHVFLLKMVIFHCFPIRSFLFENGGFFPMSFIRFLGGVKVFVGFSGPMVMIFVRPLRPWGC